MNTWFENNFDTTIPGNLRLLYSGKRERSIDHSYGPYRQENYLLTYVAEGAADFTVNGQQRHVVEYTFYVMRPHCGMTYRTDPLKPWTIYWVIVDGSEMEYLLDVLDLKSNDPFVIIRETRKMLSVLSALFERTGGNSLSDKMESMSLLYSIFSILAENRTYSAGNAYISESLDYISQHYAEELSVQNLAAALHLNYSYFSRLFKKETGLSPIRYITSVRVKKAKYLLQYSSLTVTEVARAVGFFDVLYFSRAFRRCTGVSPTTFRQLADI